MRDLQIGCMVANQIIGAKPGFAERTRTVSFTHAVAALIRADSLY